MQLLVKTIVIALLPLWLASSAVVAGQPAAADMSAAARQQAEPAQPAKLEKPAKPEQSAKPEQPDKTTEPEPKPQPEPQSEPENSPEPAPPPVADPEPAARSLSFERQEPAAERSNNSGISLGKIAISLTAVLLLVVVLGWLFKKLTMRLPGSQHVKVICSVPLGQRERLLVIEIQGKQRVLGVTPQSINMLFELETSLPETKLASDFHTQLQSFLKK